MENTDQVVEAIADALEQGLEGIVEGAKGDVARQYRLLAEKNRIRAQETGWDTVGRVVGAVLKVAVQLAA